MGAVSRGVSRPVGRARTNRLLADGAPSARSRFLQLLEPAALGCGDVLYEARTEVRYIYFPIDCLVSLLAPVSNHLPLEVAMVGDEGMVGVPLVLGMRASIVQAVVQGSGTALRMSARSFVRELPRQSALRARIDRYVHSLTAQLTQTVACNAFHSVEARCARWLLMARERLRTDRLELTHQVLAQMLGVRRVGVTIAAGNLQRRGMIAYSRGRLEILDAAGLAGAACECYGVSSKYRQSEKEIR